MTWLSLKKGLLVMVASSLNINPKILAEFLAALTTSGLL